MTMDRRENLGGATVPARKRRPGGRAAGLLLVPLCAFAGEAAAQTAPVVAERAGVEEIIVTASRREERLSKVPVSAVALDQQAIDRRGAKSMADLVRYTPGVSLQPDNGGMTAQIAIRGIKSPVGAATTGVYIDDTPVQVRAFGIATENFYPTLFDLQRVEVLRGPQGTLFGAGAEGGVVKFVTPEPSTTTSSAYVRAGVSTTENGDPSYELGAAAGGPISDKVGFRVSAFVRRDGGWIDRVDPKTGASVKDDTNANTVATARIALAFKPTDQLTITPSLYVERGLLSDRNYMWDNLSSLDGGKFRSGWLNEQPARNIAVLPALKVALEGNGVAFISNTSYFKRDLNKTSDFTTVVPPYLGIALSPVPYSSTSPLQAGQKSYTQEFRLQSNNPSDRLKWVIGAFYQYTPLATTQYVIDPQLPQLTASQGYTMLNFWGSNLIGQYSFTSNQRAVDRQLAAFGQVDLRIVDGLTATAGARVARTRLDFRNAQTGPLSNGTTTSGVSKERR